LFTSFFGNLANIPADLRPVGIARGTPRWYKGASDKRLAPTWAMLKMSRPDYDAAMVAILDRLDPRELYESLGANAVLLCWEKPNLWCHRRLVAERLEQALGIEVPELGLPRCEVLPYHELPAERKAGADPLGRKSSARGEDPLARKPSRRGDDPLFRGLR
jgi:hypothetical protein